ncbi:hypothetical protein [Streptomyces hiroshimensis]|uniref:Uncharacterized protein n=1 Tax=Streptomyces hiroshimensis TaxID=66424 RepID=A0ABQ2YHS2_9ACTN|nr:hypothetical protein [Streptomyces hiroshimensis]GGX82523.1 hypothetical protein GCM10010324_30180 [Streptomyces hiroshimensis]
MAGSALVAGGVGLLSGLWNIRRRGVASRHTRGVWRRLADRARRVRAARDARILGIPRPGETSIPAEAVNDPARPAARERARVQPSRPVPPQLLGKPSEGASMTDVPDAALTRLSDAAEVMLQAASTFDPDVMPEFEALIKDLPDAMRTVQETLRVLAEIAHEQLPVDDRVVEEMGEGYRAMNRVIDALEEVLPVYYRLHEADIDRQNNPRKGIDGERKWNV